MTKNLFISYDLHEPGKGYEKVIAVIKDLGAWAKVQYSLWYVDTTLTADQAAKRVWAAMDANDSLIVIDTTNNTARWYNVSDEVGKFIQTHWNKFDAAA